MKLTFIGSYYEIVNIDADEDENDEYAGTPYESSNDDMWHEVVSRKQKKRMRKISSSSCASGKKKCFCSLTLLKNISFVLFFL